jgi:hypothetical protein
MPLIDDVTDSRHPRTLRTDDLRRSQERSVGLITSAGRRPLASGLVALLLTSMPNNKQRAIEARANLLHRSSCGASNSLSGNTPATRSRSLGRFARDYHGRFGEHNWCHGCAQTHSIFAEKG